MNLYISSDKFGIYGIVIELIIKEMINLFNPLKLLLKLISKYPENAVPYPTTIDLKSDCVEK